MKGGWRRQGVAVSLRHELVSFPLSARLHLLKHPPHGLCLSLLPRLGEGVRGCWGESGGKDLVRVGGGEEQTVPLLFSSLGHLHLRLSHCSPPDLPDRDNYFMVTGEETLSRHSALFGYKLIVRVEHLVCCLVSKPGALQTHTG